MSRATASFTVESFDAVGQPDGADGETVLSSALLTKVFTGDVEATSTVHMLAAQTPVEGSAAYVALERIVGSVHGRKGSFVLLHAASHTDARWEVVAGSPTGELTGLIGTAVLERHEDGSHTFTLDYELPDR
ncbi:DUF3224 domain-containing protein [Cryptosporangium aurantiacum]|uniref:DUF3224 domain-containing protein n=1 Tax=Cryptosporangium aurantiacum TaxID=134849 RepID=A0A1M7QBZ7_9ACTN|nr:DUF3224 domain-containing protein [Cryptosporangium aurantiacum]SHN28033.1 Protein of unknown function [Cryptosporangium aurantiacum]